NTRDILEGLRGELPGLRVLKTEINSGHGRAIRMGYESAIKEYVFQVDSDNQFDPGDFRKLYELRDDYDFIVGLRKTRCDPAHRLILSKTIRLAIFLIFGVWIKDANCPFRLIKRKVLIELLEPIDKDALAPNIMVSILAKKKGVRMTEVPVAHYGRKTGSVSIIKWKLIRFALGGLRQLVVFRKNLMLQGMQHEHKRKK
ncbi:MAG: hypothetical protein A2Z72_05760, partial [Omnitrophica bacterium RBG_13_46_9]